MCFVLSRYKGNHKGGAAEGRPPLWRRPKAASFALALSKADILALNTAHALRLNNADVVALNKAHVLRLNNKICPVFRAKTKETTKGDGLRPPPFVDSIVALNAAHVMRLNKAEFLALNKARVLRLNNKICPVFSQSYRTTFF